MHIFTGRIKNNLLGVACPPLVDELLLLALCHSLGECLSTHPMVGQPVNQCLVTLDDGMEKRDRVVSLQLSDHQPCGPRVSLFDHSEGICPACPVCSGSNTNCACQSQTARWRTHALPLTHVECPRSHGGTQTFSSWHLAKSSVSSGLTARSQKFALVAPHMERKRNADWVSLSQGMRWKSTCCCLVLCSRNSCTCSVFPVDTPRTFTPCWAAGSKGSPRQTTASGFSPGHLLDPTGFNATSVPHLGLAVVHVDVGPTLRPTRGVNVIQERHHVFSGPHPLVDGFEGSVPRQTTMA